MKDLFDGIWGGAQKLFSFSIALGVLITFMYCLEINFYPKNMELGDGVVFILLAMTFGFVFFVYFFSIIASGFFFYSSIVRSIELIPSKFEFKKLRAFAKKMPVLDIKDNYVLMIFGGIVFFFILYLLYGGDNYRILIFFIAVFIVGFIFSEIVLYIDKNKEVMRDFNNSSATSTDAEIIYTSLEGRKELVFRDVDTFLGKEGNPQSKNKIYLYVIALLVSLIILSFTAIDGAGRNMVKMVFEYSNLKEDSVSLYVDKKHSDYIGNFLSKNSINRKMVELDGGNYRLDAVDILFQGIGNSTLIEVDGAGNKVQFIIPDNSFFVARNVSDNPSNKLSENIYNDLSHIMDKYDITYSESEKSIIFSKDYATFNVGSSSLSEPYKDVLNDVMPKLLDLLSKHYSSISKLEVIGHASLEWKESDSLVEAYYNNHELAVSRASNFVKYLYHSERISKEAVALKDKIVISSNSSNNSVDKDNRKVTIRIH